MPFWALWVWFVSLLAEWCFKVVLVMFVQLRVGGLLLMMGGYLPI